MGTWEDWIAKGAHHENQPVYKKRWRLQVERLGSMPFAAMDALASSLDMITSHLIRKVVIQFKPLRFPCK